MTCAVVRFARRKASWELPDAASIRDVEFKTREGEVDLRPSVYDIDDSGGSSSREFVRIPRNEARADRSPRELKLSFDEARCESAHRGFSREPARVETLGLSLHEATPGIAGSLGSPRELKHRTPSRSGLSQHRGFSRDGSGTPRRA